MAAPCDRSLPPREVLEAVQREAPEARPEIQSIFRQPERGPLFTQDTPVVVTVKRGDGNRPAHPPVASAPPADKRWRALQQLMIPAWQPLQALGSTPAGGDEGEPRWL